MLYPTLARDWALVERRQTIVASRLQQPVDLSQVARRKAIVVVQ